MGDVNDVVVCGRVQAGRNTLMICLDPAKGGQVNDCRSTFDLLGLSGLGHGHWTLELVEWSADQVRPGATRCGAKNGAKASPAEQGIG